MLNASNSHHSPRIWLYRTRSAFILIILTICLFAWIHSYFFGSFAELAFRRQGSDIVRMAQVESYGGRLEVGVHFQITSSTAALFRTTFVQEPYRARPDLLWYQRIGFDFENDLVTCRLTFPWWLPTFLAALSLRSLQGAYSKKLHKFLNAKILCARCNYDLRASTQICPECGTPIPSSAAVAPSLNPIIHPHSQPNRLPGNAPGRCPRHHAIPGHSTPPARRTGRT